MTRLDDPADPSASWVIRAQSLGKRYSVTHEKNAMVRGLLPHLFRPRKVNACWAVRDVALEVPRGACLVILGPNGAGKSTLLTLLAGIAAPTTGQVTHRGRIAPLLLLGAGFHPELTGEENLWLNGALLGMTDAQMRRHFAQIAAFAGLNGFLDAPLGAYSSGMRMRLGFAIAIHADADILLIDEMMAVGDQAFQARCVERLGELKRRGKTLLIAAQSVGLMRPLADRAILIHRGRIMADGDVRHVEQRYAALVQWMAATTAPLSEHAAAGVERQIARHHQAQAAGQGGARSGTGAAVIESVTYRDETGNHLAAAQCGKPLTICAVCVLRQPLEDPHFGIAIFRDDGTYCWGPNTRFDGLQWRLLRPGRYACRLILESAALAPGAYRVSVAIWDAAESAPAANHFACYPLRIVGDAVRGIIQFPHEWGMASPETAGNDRDAALTIEGPQGAQRWFRMGEPLTCVARLPLPALTPPAVIARCHGPDGTLWWASRWPMPAHALAAQMAHVRLHIPSVTLLTGRSLWSIGWDAGDERRPPSALAPVAVDVVADRLDHGIAHMPHRWKLEPCP